MFFLPWETEATPPRPNTHNKDGHPPPPVSKDDYTMEDDLRGCQGVVDGQGVPRKKGVDPDREKVTTVEPTLLGY